MALALPPPPDYMGLAICATLFFFPLGLCAIRLSQKVGLFPGLLIVFQYLVWYTVVPLCVPVVWRFQTTWGKCATWEICHMGSMPYGKYMAGVIWWFFNVVHSVIIQCCFGAKKKNKQNIHFFTFAQMTTETCCNYIPQLTSSHT